MTLWDNKSLNEWNNQMFRAEWLHQVNEHNMIWSDGVCFSSNTHISLSLMFSSSTYQEESQKILRVGRIKYVHIWYFSRRHWSSITVHTYRTLTEQTRTAATAITSISSSFILIHSFCLLFLCRTVLSHFSIFQPQPKPKATNFESEFNQIEIAHEPKSNPIKSEFMLFW